MAKLNTVKHSTTHGVMIFGAPKTGKTELVGKLSQYFNLIWVDLENGYETLLKLPEEWQARIELIRLPDTRSYPIAIETVLKMVKGPVDICEKHGKVACMICKRTGDTVTHVDLNSLGQDTIVVFDSATQLTNSAISNITKDKADDYKLAYDDWGNLGKLMDIFFSHLQQANYNRVVISHEVEAEQEDGKNVLVPVGGTRNFSRNVAKYFDHVIYAQRKNRKHVFASSTTYATNVLTGSRTDVVLDDDPAATLLSIFKPGVVGSVGSKEVKKEVVANSSSAAAGAVQGKSGTAAILERLKAQNEKAVNKIS